MENFENAGVIELRKLLLDAIEAKYGKDYLIGWLRSAYAYGNYQGDNDRDALITAINQHRALEIV
jgi:hypothetical protein